MGFIREVNIGLAGPFTKLTWEMLLVDPGVPLCLGDTLMSSLLPIMGVRIALPWRPIISSLGVRIKFFMRWLILGVNSESLVLWDLHFLTTIVGHLPHTGLMERQVLHIDREARVLRVPLEGNTLEHMCFLPFWNHAPLHGDPYVPLRAFVPSSCILMNVDFWYVNESLSFYGCFSIIGVIISCALWKFKNSMIMFRPQTLRMQVW